ncbi:Protein transport protein SEC16A [Phytophthora citrophthora]|uniref:Protein transport protein sec16 n=1 Tax=Phytophthora citrophthora TaxID=4793 RepID=A0AAD9GH09_9STRA|nr:Protein transport protein SEC16A [Phytophthora citrophthora]
MDGDRGFFSAAGGTPNASGGPPGGLSMGATRARPVSAGTRLRQKPANAATHQDFFASLGIDGASRGRTGSSASTSSNRSYNSMTMRPASASGPGSTTSSSSGWRPPPIGGLGQRATPPPMPSVGSLSIAGVNRSMTTTTTTTSISSGLSVTGASAAPPVAVPPVAAPPVTTPPVAALSVKTTTTTTTTTEAKPTQLFSMEDAEDLYSDDGWNCDSPSTVLSNPPEEEATPTDPALEAAASEAPDDEFAWGDDDDAFASPVATTALSAQPPPFEMPSASAATSTFETEATTVSQPPPQVASSFSVGSSTGPFETTSYSVTQTTTQESRPPFEHTQTGSTLPPPTTASTSFLSTESTHSTFEAKSFTAKDTPIQTAPSVEASVSNVPQDQGEQSGEDWDKHQGFVDNGSEITETTTKTYASTTVVTSILNETPIAPPVELASPGAAAGEFWGDGDEDALFDHDEHADEDWDETIKGQTPLGSIEKSHNPVSSFSAHETSFSISSQPPLATSAVPTPIQEEDSLPVDQKDHHLTPELSETKPFGQKEVISESAASFPAIPPEVSDPSADSYFEAKPETHISPFSSAMAESSRQDHDLNAFPEVPRADRYLHTPTGTGGPFGRVPSPQGNSDSDFPDEFSGTVASIAHDTQQSAPNPVEFGDSMKGESQDSYADTNARYTGLLHSTENDQLPSEDQINPRDGEAQHSTRLGQSDEEERDSVVSFSGEHSFYPSTGRPSSLYGGSQSSFASHRMYQSSVASTDHEGSSIASFGVSSAGATFGGSERVSEGGAFSDGTVSETPSMVDSSNASTAFGTDFPSVSEGQFSAPGTTIGGSDNASDGGFSDGNASETTSMCESVNTNVRFVSEFNSSSGHYVTETIERRDGQALFASSPPDSNTAAEFGDSTLPAASSVIGGDESSADANPFASSPSAFPAAASTDSSFDQQPGATAPEENVESAASLFGATAGADVPNPFSSFGASPAPPALETKPIEEHELPTSDAGDLFGSGPASSGFESSFSQPAQHSYGSNYQTHDQNYNRAGQGSYSGTSNSVQSQFASSSPFDRSAATVSSSSPFESQSTSNYGNADPFASRGATQHGFGNSAPSVDSVFSSHSSTDRNVAAHFAGSAQTGAGTGFDGNYSRSDMGTSIAADHFGQHGGDQSYGQSTTNYSDQGSVGASRPPNYYGGVQPQPQAAASTSSGQSFGQSSGVGAGVSTAGHFSRQSSTSSFTSNTAQRDTSGYGEQNRYGNQSSAPGTPDSYYQRSAASAFASGSPAQPSYGSKQDTQYGSRQYEQRSTPGTPDNYSHHSAAEVFGNTSSAQRSFGGRQDYGYSHGGQNARFGDHTRSSSSASADAFFGGASAASDFGGEHVGTPSSSSVQQAQGQTGQPSFSRSGSNTSSHVDQHGAHVQANTSAARPSSLSHDLNTSFSSVDNASISRHASSSSMNRYGSELSFQHEGIAPTRPQVDANSFFGGTPSEAVDASASSFFGNSQDSLDMQPSQSHETINPSVPEAQADEFVSPPQQETELQPQGESTHHDSSVGFGNATLVTKAIPTTSVDPTSGIVPAASSDLDQHKTNSFDETASTDAIAESAPTEQHSSPFGNEQDTDRPQAFDGFSASGSEQASSNFFSSSPALQTDTASSSYQSDQMGYHHQEQQQQQQQQQQQHNQAHNAAAASMQFAKAHSSFQHTSAVGTGASYGDSGVHTAAAHASSSYFDSGAPRAGSSGPANYSQHQMQQQRPQQQQYDQYQQEPHHQGTTGFSFHGATGQAQLRAAGYNASNEHQNGTAAGSGYGAMNTQQSSHPVAAPVTKTSNKYKDPCVAPPSCLASFGFGGNVVTMFPKRKLRLNITGSGYRNSPRGVPPPSEFENGGNGELRKGPVNLYHMDQLHPKDKEFEQMDTFPGPLTDDVSDEAILEYLDDRLKRSEAPTTVAEVEDENDRLLLGVLRVLVKCNGKLRSDPGTLNPSDPDSPEAQLISLLSENSKRRSGNQVPTFPAPRKVQSVTHPDLMVKHANQLRELLLVGDRKGAVSSAMAAHMWPEAMLIASFTDKEEYRRVLRTYLDETYATGDPCRALFMAFADQQEKSVQEPKRLLQTNAQQPAQSPVLTAWVSHAQVLLANRTADTSKILTELGDRLWSEDNAVAAAHICYLLAGIQVEAPMPTSKMALLGGDHRTPTEARFYVSPGAVQRTEIYEWAQKQSKGSSANLMIPFQGYKLIYAMLLADHGKLEIAFKYVTSMLTVIKAVTATMKPGTSMYLEGMKNQLTVLDDRLRQHLGQDRVASVAASTQRGSGRKQGKWGLGSALSMMGKIVNRVVEGNDASAARNDSGGLYANEATPPAASYPGTPSVTAPTSSPTPSYPQQHAQQTPSPHAHMTPPASSHGPSPIPANIYNHATPPASQGSAPGSSNGYNRTPATAYSRPGPSGMQSSGPFSGNGRPGLQHQQSSGPFSGNGRPGSAGPFSNNGPGSQKQGAVHLMRSQHSMEPPGSNHSNRSFSGVLTTPTNSAQQHPPQYQQPPSSQSSQHSQHSQHSQDTPTARPAFQKPTPLDLSDDTSSLSQPKTFAAGLVAEVATSLPPLDPTTMSGPSSDKGKASPKFKSVKKPGRSKTPPPSGSAKTSGWLSGLSSFIATKMNPEAKVAKLGEQMEAYFDEDQKRWVFPGEQAAEEPAMPSAPPTGPISGSAPGSSAGMPPMGTNSAPGSMSSGPAPSDDPLAALMAPPPSHMLMKKDPLAAMMAPPSRTGGYGARRGGSTAQRKPPRPQFAVFKPSAAPASAPDEPSE